MNEELRFADVGKYMSVPLYFGKWAKVTKCRMNNVTWVSI